MGGSEGQHGAAGSGSGGEFTTGTTSTTDTTGGSGQAGWEKPQVVRGLYVPGNAASGQKLDGLLEVAEETEVNALVVDVKEGGYTTYPSEVPLARGTRATTEQIPDLEALVQRLEERVIYTIARLFVFNDGVMPEARPGLAVQDTATGGLWHTFQGATWSNPYQERTWEYNAAIAREVAEAGFDEIQLDYVRFPSDGPMNRLEYGQETAPSQEAAIAGFLEYTQKELEPTGAELSAEVFGLVGINDFVGIGQVSPRWPRTWTCSTQWCTRHTTRRAPTATDTRTPSRTRSSSSRWTTSPPRRARQIRRSQYGPGSKTSTTYPSTAPPRCGPGYRPPRTPA